ncbi:MAG: family 43 glycosylhydrolase [Candidatus Cryptobacteroides sp.]
MKPNLLKRINFPALIAFAAAISAFQTGLSAQNPISPPGVYIADPSARVAPDGRLYIYGSRDESPEYYCSDLHDLLSTGDLLNWRLDRGMFRWGTTLYAPDAIFKDSKTYLFFDVPDGTEYVAEGPSPAGPFSKPGVIEGPREIDPCVFIDDDGQAYYFYGQFSAKGAKLNPDMRSLEPGSLVEGIVDEENHFFHEGSFVFKRGKYYYFVYAHIGRNHRPTCIGYSMATSPLGPYTYKGVIVDNAGCDPEVWNNHGSVVQFKGKWYVLYHRATHGCVSMRKACIEPISFNADGTIDEVPMTSQGAGKPLDAFSPVEAARACGLAGNARIALMEGRRDKEILDKISSGDSAVWRYVDFGKGASSAVITVRAPEGGRISLSAGGRRLCTFEIPASEGWQELSTQMEKASGVHVLKADFSDCGTGLLQLDQIRFGR